MIDALASGSAFFDRPGWQIKSVVITIADAMLANETRLRSRTPGTKNVKMMTVSGHTRAPLWSPQTKAAGRSSTDQGGGNLRGPITGTISAF
jgi:hypothetical protein